jgi:protein PET100
LHPRHPPAKTHGTDTLQFGTYVLFPIGWMYYFGTNLDNRFATKDFWPTAEQSHKIPLDKEEIDQELARMRMVDAVKRERRLAAEAEQAQLQAQVQSQSQATQSEQ